MATRGGVRGTRELSRAFRQFADAMTASERKKARNEALKPFVSAAARNLVGNDSVVTGALVASLGTAEAPQRRNRTEAGPRKGKFKGQNPAARAHLVEFPVAPHYQPNRLGGIMHPGHPGYPFARPAFEETRDDVVRIYFEVASKIIDAAAKRTAARARKR